MSSDSSNNTPPIMIAARAAHIMLGNRVKGKAMAIGNSAEDGSLLIMDRGPDNEILGSTDTTPWSLVLCQWDDSRAIFALDSDGHIYDENTPLNGQWSSWTHANDKIFSTATIPKADKMKDLVYANFQNLQTTVGLKEAMFYLTAVAYDIDVYEASNGQIKTAKVLESMMENYRLIDNENLDAIEAATIKAYGRPKFYDLDFSRLAGRWTDWEGDLTKLSLPSTMWLILRRATGLLGRVDRSIVIPVIKLFIPDATDLTQTIMTRIPALLVQSWLKVLRSWVKPDTPGLWADASRLEWVIEYIKLTNLLVYDPNPWSQVTPNDDWSVEVKTQFDQLRELSPENQLHVLVNTWDSVLNEVFYPSVQDSSEADSDILDETVVDTLHKNLELESTVLAFASLLTDADSTSLNPDVNDNSIHSTSDHKSENGNDNNSKTSSNRSNGSVPQAVDDTITSHKHKDDATITKSSSKDLDDESKDSNESSGKSKSSEDTSNDTEEDFTKEDSTKNHHKLNKLSNHTKNDTGESEVDGGTSVESSNGLGTSGHSRLRRVEEVPESEDDGEIKSSRSKTLRKSIIPETTADDDDPDMIDWSEVMISDDED